MEPEFSAEMIAPMSDEKRLEWFQHKARLFADDGAVWHRFSQDANNENRLIYEGWRSDPGVDGATDKLEFVYGS